MIRTAPPHAWQVSMSMSPEAPTVGEHPFQTLRPGHRGPAFDRCGLLQTPCRKTPASPAPQGPRHPPPVPAIGREQPLETGQVAPGLGYLGWDDINVYSVGLQYQANKKLTLRAGYRHADATWKDVNTLFNVLAPATVEQHASLGATYILDKQSRISFAYTHTFRSTIEGNSTFTGPQTGYVRMLQNIVQISYSRDIGI